MDYKTHRHKWNNCQLCSLCLTRKFVVLARGSIPSDILFIGEAPGQSEDKKGQPFYGPAGALLDKIIAKAVRGRSVRIAFTNLVACLPLGSDGKKTGEPDKEHIEACTERLEEMIDLCEPKYIIRVGKLADEYIAAYDYPQASIIHPAAILRSEIQNQGLLIQNCVVTINDVIEELGL